MIIKVESLDRIFEQHNTANHFSYQGKCHNCGCNVEVEITKTSCGYGLQGGVLCESNPEDILVCCLDCHQKDLVPNKAVSVKTDSLYNQR